MEQMEEKMGSLKEIVIIPGWTYSTHNWDKLSLALRKAGYQVHIMSVPGLTKISSRIWDLESYIRWLDKKLENYSKVILMGHSNGGRIALAYAAARPNNISKLVLIDSAGVFHNEPLVRLKRFVFRMVTKVGKDLGVSKKFRWVIYKLAREHDYERASPEMRETMKNIIYRDLTPLMKKIKFPTLIIWGENDTITPLADGKVINSLIRGSKLFIVKGAQHSPFYTHPKKVTKIVAKNL